MARHPFSLQPIYMVLAAPTAAGTMTPFEALGNSLTHTLCQGPPSKHKTSRTLPIAERHTLQRALQACSGQLKCNS
jgi:hypothetical protein